VLGLCRVVGFRLGVRRAMPLAFTFIHGGDIVLESGSEGWCGEGRARPTQRLNDADSFSLITTVTIYQTLSLSLSIEAFLTIILKI
jgi:hypothetical protein